MAFVTARECGFGCPTGRVLQGGGAFSLPVLGTVAGTRTGPTKCAGLAEERCPGLG